MIRYVISVLEFFATITFAMLIAMDIITAARMRASLVKLPIRVSRRSR